MIRSSICRAFIIANCCAFSLVSQPLDTKGWNKTVWGMTEDQVLAALPGLAKRQAGPEADRPFRGLITPIIIDTVEIDGTPTRVRFRFDPATRELVQVHLEPTRPQDQTEDVYQRLELLLITKYGRPWRSSSAETRITLWRLPSSLITLRLSTARAINFRSLSITYEPRHTEDLL